MRTGAVDDRQFKPMMRTKRGHRKSRFGCMTCKERRVKCDERRPICKICQGRGTECVYANKAPSPTSNTTVKQPLPAVPRSPPVSDKGNARTSQGVSLSATSPISLPDLYQTNTPFNEVLASAVPDDTRFARHYFEFTSHSLSRCSARSEQHWIWHVFIPSLSYTSETVLHGILALGAISQHFQDQDMEAQPSAAPQEASQSFRAAVAHGEIFVKQSRSQLNTLHAAHVDANTACTRLLSVLAFAFFRHYRQVGIELVEHQAWTWLRLLRGVQTVHVSLLKSEQKLDPIIKQDMMPELFSFAQTPTGPLPTISGNALGILAFIRDTQNERLEMLRKAHEDGTLFFTGEGSCTLKHRSATLAAINSLAQVTEHICAWYEMHSLFRAICTWPGSIPDEFVQLLVQCDYSALVIHAHWLMLTALAEDLWWLGDMGRTGIRAIVDLIPQTEVGLHSLLNRPQDLLLLMSSTP